MMRNLSEPTQPPRNAKAPGFVLGTVLSNLDPQGRGRVTVKLDTLGTQVITALAPVVSPNANFTFLPELGEQVVVGFFNGDLNDPFVVGSVQNGIKPAPASNSIAGNNKKVIKTRMGHSVTFDDAEGKIEISNLAGTTSITINTTSGMIDIQSTANISLTSAGGDISMKATNISMEAAAEVSVKGGAAVAVEASGSMDLKGATINLN